MLPEVGAAELLVIAAIALIVVGPKDLPVLLRRLGKFVAHMRNMAAEFRASFDEMARQSELDELRKEVEALRRSAQDPAAAAAAHVGLDEVEHEISRGFEAAQYNPHAEPEPAPAPAKPRRKAAAKPASPAKTKAPAKPKPPAKPAPAKAPARRTAAKAPAAPSPKSAAAPKPAPARPKARKSERKA